MHQIKKAIIDADIKNHGDKIRPPSPPKKKVEIRPVSVDSDPYNLLKNQEMPEAIPGMFRKMPTRTMDKKKQKEKNQHDDIVESSALAGLRRGSTRTAGNIQLN